MNNWNNLSMAQRAGVMKLAVENGVYDLDTIRGAYNEFAEGGSIHIKPENRGKFTRLKERTGHSATWFKEHGTPAQKKMAIFALNSRHWKHGLGGPLVEAANKYPIGGYIDYAANNASNATGAQHYQPGAMETINNVLSYMPITGTVMDMGEFIKEPTWENFGWAVSSLASDALGASLLKGTKVAKAEYKAAKQAEKNAEEALNTHRQANRNIIARSIREEDAKLVKQLNDARWNTALKTPFWNKVIEYPVFGAWLAEDAGLNTMQQNSRANGGLIKTSNIYDGTTENSQQMNIMAYHPIEDYFTGPSAIMPEINVTRKKDGKTYVGLGDFSDRYDRKKRPYFVSSRTGQLTAANAAKAWDAMVTPALSWALPNVFRGIDAAQRGDAVGVGKEALKAAGLKVAGTVAASPSLAAPGSAFWMNPMTKQIAAGTAASEGVNLATNVLTPYNTWGEGISDVVNQATGWNPQDSWWGQTMAEATNPGWLVNPSRVMGTVGRVGSAVENGVKAAYDNGTLWDAYTTFGGRFGNYGDNLATSIYGTAARRFGLPDKARVPADAMRKIKGDVHVDNGVVDLTGNKPYLGNPHVNATLDRGVVSHSKGAWDGANTYITPTRNFLEQTQGSLKSIEPSDMFSNGARVTEAPQNVTLISGDVASLNKAREAGMQTLSSPRLRRIYQEEEAKYLAEKAAFDEQYANASGIQRLMLKAPESPKSKKWWPEYTKEVQRLQAQRGTPTLSDFRLLEEQTGLSSGTAPVSEMQNAVRQLEAMQNASISDIEAGRVQPYVYPNGRVVDWDKVAEELALIKRAKYNKVFYDPASYVESDWQVANGVK